MTDFAKIKFTAFFDRQTLFTAIEKKNNAVLARTGAFARKVMKQGMRRRKGPSSPGEYPHAHAGQLRDLIFFAKDGNGVVVGPLLFASSTPPAGKTVPELVNEGGTVQIRRINKVTGKPFTRSARYRPRPFVDLTLPKAEKALRDNMEKIPFK